MKFDISEFFETLTRKFNLHSNMRQRIMCTLHEDLFTFMVNNEKYYRQKIWRK